MKTFWAQFFTWWSGQTLGTRFHTWRHGEFVGSDAFGNRYYQTRGGAKDPALGIVRRWVVYGGEAEATTVPPGWVGWLRHTTQVPPSRDGYVAREWERAHLPTMTGTSAAYRPSGSILASGERPRATGDYEAWTPGP
jgi:NADH:ubiquinone oxidoreductase subunit